MPEISILDCTLRDGGYVNGWLFGETVIQNIIKNLADSNVDFIECGFLKQFAENKNESLYKIPNIEENNEKTKYVYMINYSEHFELPKCEKENIYIRVAFKKHEVLYALEYCKELQNKGYKIFVHPMMTNHYSINELINLIQEVNQINPFAFTIADTIGNMREKDVLKTFYLIDKILNPNIKLCFHSHNNMQLSYSNAQILISAASNRDLIIDSSLFGMGRGAGNLPIELISLYLNENLKKEYNIELILDTINQYILEIFKNNPWGYSICYYLSAKNNCHPNYGKFLADKNLSTKEIDKILSLIPDENRSVYEKNIIEGLLNECCV